MAETQEKKKYSHLGTEVDQDLLIANLKHNAESYARYHNWDDVKSQEFYSALDTYIKAMSEGRLSGEIAKIVDSEGVLNDGEQMWTNKAGEKVSKEEYDRLKKRKQKKLGDGFQPNRYVATYIGKIAGSLADDVRAAKAKETPATPPKFSFENHGLWQQFVHSISPTGTGDLEAWLDLDEYNQETKTRGTTNRAKHLYDYISSYIKNLPEDLDFAETVWKTRDQYIEHLKKLQTSLEDGADAADFRLLNQLGGSPEAYRTFFTTSKEATAPAAQQESTESTEETTARLNALDKQYRDLYTNTGYAQYNLGRAPVGVSYNKKAKNQLEAYMNALNANNIPFDLLALQSTTGQDYLEYLEQYGEMVPEAVQTVQVGQWRGWNYIPESLSTNDFTVLGYNPVTHSVRRLYLGDLGMDARDRYAQLLREIDAWSQTSQQPLFAEGGQIQKLEMGAPIGNGAAAQFAQQLKAQGQKTQADPTTGTAFKKNDNEYSAGDFTSAEITRLGAIAADIIALIDPEPISAFALGLGSDIANLTADISEGRGFWETAGNFAANVGLSAVGIVPIFGDALGSGVKVGKAFVKLAPKVSNALIAAGVLQTVTNGEAIINSFRKFGKDGPENEMTIEDWRNIANGIQLILGGTNAIKNASTVRHLSGKTTQPDKVEVRVKSKANGEEKIYQFLNEKDITALRAAKTPEEVNAVINSHKSLKDKYEVVSRDGLQWDGSKWKPWTWGRFSQPKRLKSGAVRDAVDYSQLTAQPGQQWFSWNGRSRYIETKAADPSAGYHYGYNQKNHVVETVTDKPTTPRTKTETKKPSTPKTGNAGTMTPAEVAKAIEGAKKAFTKYRTATPRVRLKGMQQHPHSTHGKKLMADQGMTEQDLFDLGLWKEGGVLPRVRKIVKGEGGIPGGIQYDPFKKTDPLARYVKALNLPTLQVKPEVTPTNFSKPSPLETTPALPNYGTNYTSTISDYSNGEYGTTEKVNLSAIQAANAKKRSSDLTTTHGDPNYLYTDAQYNTDKARQAWQTANDGKNRVMDFTTWAREQYKAGKFTTQADMIAEYNKLIDQQYQYKREMGTAEHSGDKSYRKDEAVKTFNTTNRDIYRSANSVGGVNGWDEDSANVNGTTTAQRFIDITDKDIAGIHWDDGFTENDSAEFKALFSNDKSFLIKDKTGRYYSLDRPVKPAEPATRSVIPPVGGQTPSGNQESGADKGGSDTNKINDDQGDPASIVGGNKSNWLGILSAVGPNMISAARYAAALWHNKRQEDIAHKMPVMLYDPKWRYRWIRGDVQALQRGQQEAARLQHMANAPITSDGMAQTAAMFSANEKGQVYKDNGARIHDTAITQSRELNWQQEGLNLDSFHQTAMTNRGNLVQKRASDLAATAGRYRADFGSLDQGLGQLEKMWTDYLAETKDLRVAAAKSNIENEIAGNLGKYGISTEQTDQDLITKVYTGTVAPSELSEQDQVRLAQLKSKILSLTSSRWLHSLGINYNQYVASTPQGGWDFDKIAQVKSGGRLLHNGDTEKISIQKLRGRIQKMQTRQRQLAEEMKNYQKDLDRAQRSSSQYIRGQIRK